MCSSARWGHIDLKLYVYKNDDKPEFYEGVELMTLRDAPVRWNRAHLLDVKTGELLQELTDRADDPLGGFISTNSHVALKINGSKK